MTIKSVEELYLLMKQPRLCRNESDFSVNWCGMSDSYYRLRGENISIAALFTCWDRLQASGQFSLAQGCLALLRERNKVNQASEGNRGPRNRRATAELAA